LVTYSRAKDIKSSSESSSVIQTDRLVEFMA